MNNSHRGSGSSSSDWARMSEFDELMNKLENTERLVLQMMEMMQLPIPTTNQAESETEGSETEEDHNRS